MCDNTCASHTHKGPFELLENSSSNNSYNYLSALINSFPYLVMLSSFIMTLDKIIYKGAAAVDNDVFQLEIFRLVASTEDFAFMQNL